MERGGERTYGLETILQTQDSRTESFMELKFRFQIINNQMKKTQLIICNHMLVSERDEILFLSSQRSSNQRLLPVATTLNEMCHYHLYFHDISLPALSYRYMEWNEGQTAVKTK